MAGNISGLHPFANDVGPVPLKLLDDSFSTLSITLNTLSTFSNFYQDTGSTNAYTINTTQYQFVSYTDGLQVTVRIANTNTGASTLNVNGLGAMPILTSIGSELQPNALVAGSIVTFVYNAQRTAWQIASGGGGGQITAPLHVTNPSGQAALSINPDGSGYLGDFTGNGLSWDAACHFTFEGGATLAGIQTPFSISDTTGAAFFQVVDPNVTPVGESCVTSIGPAGTNHSLQTILCLNGATNGSVLRVAGAQNTIVGPTLTDATPWLARFHGAGYYPGEAPPGYQPPTPGASFGVVISAGTNANDVALLVEDDAEGGTGTATYRQFFLIRGDGTGGLGPSPNQLVWDAAGHFTLTGTATLPPAASINSIGDVTITNPQNGQSLIYNSATQQWVNSTPVTQLVNLSDVHVVSPQPGQVLTYSVSPLPGWVNGTIPAYAFLTTVSTTGAQPGDALTWNGSGWVPAAPGQVVNIPLSGLTDVGITTPLNRQVLTYDAPSSKWINAPAAMPSLSTLPDVAISGAMQGQILSWDGTLNRWVNSALPGGSVIALGTLQDVNISDPQNNQVLKWDYASARWVNGTVATTLAGLTDVTVSGATAGQVLTYNGTRWVNGGNAVIAANAPGTALNVYGISGSPTLVARVLGGTNNPGIFVTNTEATGNTTIDFSGTSNSNGTIAVGGVGAMGFSGLRGVNIGPPAGGTALTVAGALNGSGLVVNGTGGQNQYACWAGTFNCGVSGGYSNGVFIGAGSGSGDQCVQFMNSAQDKNFFLIRGDGSGVLGSGTNNLSWDTSSFFTFNQAVRVNGKSGNAAFGVQAPTDNWAGSFSGTSYGLKVASGSTNADYSFMVANAANSATNFLIYGDGSGSLGVPGQTLTWSTGGIWQLGSIFRIWYSGNQLFRCGDQLQTQSTNWMASLPGYPTLQVWSANHTANNIFPLRVLNTGSAAGSSNGVYIQGGLNSNDQPFRIDLQDQSRVNFVIRGDGGIYMTLPPSNAVTSATPNLYWSSNFYLYYITSVARHKKDIRSVARQRAREVVAKLRSVTYRSRCEGDDQNATYYGMIAEEVAAVDPCLATYDEEGQPQSVAYDRIAMLLLPLVQELLGMDEPTGEIYG